jgi:transcriptional regulator with XRE-family HTH domain
VSNLLQRLGQRIRELRSQKGWSQEEFAEVCGVHRTYIGHLERGEKNVSFGSIVRVATALNVTLSELFARVESEDASRATQTARRRRNQAQFDRDRVLKALASLERTVRVLKEITEERPNTPSRKRPMRKSSP